MPVDLLSFDVIRPFTDTYYSNADETSQQKAQISFISSVSIEPSHTQIPSKLSIFESCRDYKQSEFQSETHTHTHGTSSKLLLLSVGLP